VVAIYNAANGPELEANVYSYTASCASHVAGVLCDDPSIIYLFPLHLHTCVDASEYSRAKSQSLPTLSLAPFSPLLPPQDHFSALAEAMSRDPSSVEAADRQQMERLATTLHRYVAHSQADLDGHLGDSCST
jgi:hypothetical protein